MTNEGTNEAITVLICLDHASLKGGQERVAFDSAIGLKQQGHRPIVFAAAGPVATTLIEAGIETICLDQSDLSRNPSRLAGGMQGLWNQAAARALDAVLETLPRASTVVHVHGWATALSPSIAVPIARSRLPAVFTIHDYYQFCPNGGFYNYKREHICKLAPLSAACWMTHCDTRSYAHKLWRNARLLSAKHVARLPDVFSTYITLSDLQQAVVAPLVPKRATMHRVANPVCVPDLGQKPDAAAGEMIFIGRLSPEKGPLFFAEAARRIGIVPTFIGEGPLAAELAARYPEARLLGWRKQADVHQAMRAARALVFPSIWYEGQPLAVLEAKGLGLPVIVSDACAGRESIQDGRSGLWFKSADIDDLARALRAFQDDATVRAMSAAAYADYWAAPPTLHAHVDRLVQVYRGALDPQLASASFKTGTGLPLGEVSGEEAPALADCDHHA